MKAKFPLVLAAAFSMAASLATAADKYELDASHSQILFGYNHLGYSTTWNMFSGFEGSISYDKENPAESSVEVSIPVKSLFTGWEGRFTHFMSDDFFGAKDGDLITFTSTAISVTGDKAAEITGDLTINGVTKSVVLDATMNGEGIHPFSKKEHIGFDATTTILRSDYGLGRAAPNVSDELDVQISIEASKAE